jgi:hypothetical protein
MYNRSVILSSEAKTNICDDAFEVKFSLVLQLSAPDQEAMIKNELLELIFYLNGI